MTKIPKITISVLCLIGIVSAASAVDQAAAAADLASIAAMSVESKAGLSDAALAGDVDAITEAGERSDAIDTTMAQAQESYSEMERAVASGDEDAAQSAADDVKFSHENAVNALAGVIPEDVAEAVKGRKGSKKNTRGGPGSPSDPPNIYDIPWNSQTMRNFYQNHFGNLWNSGICPHDRDATPE